MNDKHALAPWEMMREAKDCLGLPALNRIFKIGNPGLYAQMVNPDYSAKSCRPVIQRVRMMLHDLMESGGDDLARAMLDYMAAPLGMHAEANAAAEPDQEDLRDECLDDYPVLAGLHELIRSGADIRQVEASAVDVRREVDETVQAYRRSLEGGGE